MSLIELFSAIIITFVIGGLISSLIDDFVFTIKIDKKMLMNIVNSLIFMYVTSGMEIRGMTTRHNNIVESE